MEETPKPVEKVEKKKPVPKPTENKKMITNISKVIQWIGSKEVEPGKGIMMDVSPGSMGEALIRQGDFCEGKPKQKAEEPRVGFLRSKEEDLESAHAKVEGLFICPWCGNEEVDQTKAQQHIHREHYKEFFGFILELYDKNPNLAK